MKKLIAVRHGEYDHSHGSLVLRGEEQIKLLAVALSSHIKGEKVRLFHSPFTRTAESAFILGRILNVEFEMCVALERDDFSDANHIADALQKQLGNSYDNVDILIVVTHFEAPAGLINHFMTEGHIDNFLSDWEISKGTALVLNIESNEVTVLP